MPLEESPLGLEVVGEVGAAAGWRERIGEEAGEGNGAACRRVGGGSGIAAARGEREGGRGSADHFTKKSVALS